MDIDSAGDSRINAQFNPPLSGKPLAVIGGKVVRCILGEIKADWKFHKDIMCLSLACLI